MVKKLNKTGTVHLELGTTLYHNENRMRPIFTRDKEGLKIVKWVTWDEYLQLERKQ